MSAERRNSATRRTLRQQMRHRRVRWSELVMADEIINNEWKAREVKSAGAGKLKVISLR